jgi:hypothetical protein
MKIAKLCSALALVGLASTAHAVNLVSEGFEDITTLSGSGWVLANVSSPSAGTPWFQGDNTTAFTSQSGADNSYIASNFTAAPPGGFIDNFLITPYFSLASDVTLTFYARADVIDGFSDTFAVLAGTTMLGSGEAVTEVIHPTVATGGDWTMYTVTLAGQGGGAVGRFAFEYFGDADSSNYIGFDTVTVAVPEPETYALMALGLAALALRRRKAA